MTLKIAQYFVMIFTLCFFSACMEYEEPVDYLDEVDDDDDDDDDPGLTTFIYDNRTFLVEGADGGSIIMLDTSDPDYGPEATFILVGSDENSTDIVGFNLMGSYNEANGYLGNYTLDSASNWFLNPDGRILYAVEGDEGDAVLEVIDGYFEIESVFGNVYRVTFDLTLTEDIRTYGDFELPFMVIEV